MKRCSACGQRKEPEAYHRHRRRPDGRQSVCIDCKQVYNRTYYEKNAGRHRDLRRIQRTQLRTRIREAIVAAKDVPCADCGQRFPVEAMDFDHVRGTKVADVTGMRGMGLTTLQHEIAKCDVVCVCCHRRRTRHLRIREMLMALAGWVPSESNRQPFG